MKQYCITLHGDVHGCATLHDSFRGCMFVHDGSAHGSTIINDLPILYNISADNAFILTENDYVVAVLNKYSSVADDILVLSSTGSMNTTTYASSDNGLVISNSGAIIEVGTIGAEENSMTLSESNPETTMLRLRYLYEMEHNTLSDFNSMTLYDVDYIEI